MLFKIFDWANANQGVLSLIAIIIAFPTLLIFVFQILNHLKPSKKQRQQQIKEQFAHASEIKSDVEKHAEWNNILGSYGEFLVRDVERILPQTEENHSQVTTPYSIVVLTSIHSEHLEFTLGTVGIKHIKKIADHWHYSDSSEEGALKVETVFWLNYRDIAFVRWITDSYWEWPQVFCNFTAANKFPFTKLAYAVERKGLPRPFYEQICLYKDVSERPAVLRRHTRDADESGRS